MKSGAMRRAAATVTAALLLAGCGYETAGALRAQPATPTAAPSGAVSANSACVQATPVVAGAQGVMRQLQRGSITAADARRMLGPGQTTLDKLARSTTEPVLQENLSQATDAVTTFRAVLANPSVSAYPDAQASLNGTLAGFGRVCSVGTPGAPPSVPVTLKGSEQVGLWARAVSGTPTLTLQVSEVSGGSVLGSQQVTMRLDQSLRFTSLTYRIRHPGASSLRVTVSAPGMAPGKDFLVNDITIVRS